MEAGTVGEIIEKITLDFPELKKHLLDQPGRHDDHL